ncbi:MAG: NAD(P)-binding domain-containing protein, partial [Comamonas sp.]|nr:NAD(P)-binding domain-containing protein [Comamonas sp.]
MQIALIGCGAIGSALLELVQNDAGLQIAAIVVPGDSQGAARAVAQRLAPGAQVVQTVPAAGIDLVVEAAGHAAITQHVLPALQRGLPCIVASV